MLDKLKLLSQNRGEDVDRDVIRKAGLGKPLIAVSHDLAVKGPVTGVGRYLHNMQLTPDDCVLKSSTIWTSMIRSRYSCCC